MEEESGMSEFSFDEESEKKYRVRPGMAHYYKGEKHTGGQILSLTDRQYKAFRDKFIPTEETEDIITKRLTEDDSKKFVLAGRERHSSSRYLNWGYPQRVIRSKDFLYIWNLKPDRWPSGLRLFAPPPCWDNRPSPSA